MIPIPAFLVKRVGETVARLIIMLCEAVIVVCVVVAIYLGVKNYFTGGLKTEVKITRGQADAAIKSGEQGVNTVANRQAEEQAGADNVQELQHAIDNGSDPAAVTDAGLAGLHRVRGRQTERHRQ